MIVNRVCPFLGEMPVARTHLLLLSIEGTLLDV